MGDLSSTAPSSKELHVLVTGFGPFKENAVNPSYLVSSALPATLTTRKSRKIHIHTLAQPVRVAYKSVRENIPSLLFPPVTGSPRPIFDLVIFIGMAGKREYYSLETQAHRDGYSEPDVDGEHLRGRAKHFWGETYGAPETLQTAFDADDVHQRWQHAMNGTDVRLSNDAGSYLCDFIYFTGLVEYWRRGVGKGAVVFLHVPQGTDERSIATGIRVVEELIIALVASVSREPVGQSKI